MTSLVLDLFVVCHGNNLHYVLLLSRLYLKRPVWPKKSTAENIIQTDHCNTCAILLAALSISITNNPDAFSKWLESENVDYYKLYSNDEQPARSKLKTMGLTEMAQSGTSGNPDSGNIGRLNKIWKQEA